MPAADLALVGGSVMTMAAPAAQSAPPTAVAIAGGRITAVGDDRTIETLIGPRTRRIDLRGRSLLPGFTDAHVHPVSAGVEPLQCGLHELPQSRDAYLAFSRNDAIDR